MEKVCMGYRKLETLRRRRWASKRRRRRKRRRNRTSWRGLKFASNEKEGQEELFCRIVSTESGKHPMLDSRKKFFRLQDERGLNKGGSRGMVSSTSNELPSFLLLEIEEGRAEGRTRRGA